MTKLTQTDNNLIKMVRDAGIVGEGGAGFPAHVKYNTQVETLIANGCECEPLLYSDQYIMQHHARKIVRAMQAVMSVTGATRGILGIKKKYVAIATEFKEAMVSTELELMELDNFYPAGDEQILIYELTGKTIPPLGLPVNAGIIVANVGSLFSVSNAMDGIPVTHKIVTVTGDVLKPSIINVPIGTSVKECIENCGGTIISDPVTIIGGPMMGRFIEDQATLDREVITKTTGGIIVLPRGHFLHEAGNLSFEIMQKRAASACIQCRMCTEMCPRYLIGHEFETHRVMRALAGGSNLTTDTLQAMMCCECGVCELFACPMGLSPRRVNVMLKARFRQEGLQYQGPLNINSYQTEFREFRRVPTPRLGMKIDIEKYMNLKPEFEGNYLPSQVRIPLRQHIGDPSVPIVKPGDRVNVGDCIADIAPDVLGAKLHASISGIIKTIDTSIIIEGT
ncbi:MAG: propanediol utilization protein [Deltaproteobacteria bacterium]|nr:MAG: propanediol utilization protein [Deltaproteobacteria bacterium]